jgi:pseudaminic acid cytidylyltransferase
VNSLAIIPARGGSKRIPRKNIRDFLGKPIIAYSIETALDSGLFSEVMVSTDDHEIAAVATRYGASVPFLRSKKASDDLASTVDVISEVFNEYERINKRFEFACCIYATAPFITKTRIQKGYEMLVNGNYDSVFPITRFSYPIWRALTITNSKIGMIWPENLDKRSQDLPPAFHDAGQWYWFNKTQIMKGGKLWTENSFGIEVSEMEVQDIDSESDWSLAELKFQLFLKRTLPDVQ